MEETSASQSRPNNNNNNTQRIPLPPPPRSIHLNNHNNPHRSLPLPPPPSQANYNSRRPPPSSSSSSKPSFRGCCCCLILLFSFIALLTLSIILTIILAIKPKKPQFNLQQVAVQYMGITSPNLFSSSSLSTTTTTDTAVSATASLSINIKLMFTASNPNKVGIKYKESKFTVMYRGIPLGKARVRGFYQEAYSEREVEAVIDVERVNLMQADASEIVRDASLNDRVELRVLGDVGANIRLLDLDSPPLQVSVDCSIVISPRNQSLTYKQCGFDGLNL